jgi:hypothetical protein
MVKQTSTVLAGALMSALVVIPLALWFVVGSDPDATAMPSPLLLAAPVVAGVAVHVLLEAIGYRTQPIAPGTPYDEATAQSLMRWQTQMVQRFAFSEVIAIATVALCFVLAEGGYLVLLVGCATSLVLMAVHVYPWSRPVGKFAASLEKDGGRSGLREAFGMESRPGGAIQEL